MAWLRLSLSFDNICYVLSLVLNIAFGRRVLFTFSVFFFGDGFQSTLSDYFYNAGSFGTSDNIQLLDSVECSSEVTAARILCMTLRRGARDDSKWPIERKS